MARLKAFFHDKTSTSKELDPFEALNPKRSNWTPLPGQYPALDSYIYKNVNITSKEREAITRLRNNPDIVIKPADKGGAIVVLRKDLYIQEAERQLSNADFYEEVQQDLTQDHNDTVIRTVEEFIDNGDLPESACNLICTNPRQARFYLLPKIHKANTPGRPVVSTCNYPTELISSYLDSVLTPIVESLPSYVKDTNDALRIFDHFEFSGPNRLLFTMDVKSLYTVIHIDEALVALKYFLDRTPSTNRPSTTTLIRLADLVLKLSSFEFNNKHFIQKSGIVMGTKLGPSMACIFMGYIIEDQIFSQYNGIKPDLYRRYIDDIIGFSSCSRDDLEKFINYVKSFHPSLDFTFEISNNSLSFLDIQVLVNQDNNKLRTSVY
ncbi:uncharacterized protein [Amphiura filiformis]|uniref:uncharacterized protein n=1 Tax=Amphiura filiformis TaxID=82378 RepID=UPI003B222A77